MTPLWVHREAAKRVVAFLARAYDLTSDDILGDSREARISEARHMVVWTLNKACKLNHQALGKLLGRHYTTARNSIDRVDQRRRADPDVREFTDSLVVRARELHRELQRRAIESSKELAL